MADKNYLTIFVEKSKLVFVDPAVAENKEFKFPKELIRDLEVVDEKKLKSTLADFIKSAEIKTKKVIMIFSESTYLEKRITKQEFPQKTEIVESFSDLVPFEDIFVRELKNDEEIRLVVINRDFYEPILNILNDLKFKLSSIFPEFAISKVLGKYDLDQTAANNIVKSLAKLRSFDLLRVSKEKDFVATKDVQALSGSEKSLKNIKSDENKKLRYLLLLLGALVVFMVIILVGSANKKKEKAIEAEQRAEKIQQEQQLLKERAEQKANKNKPSQSADSDGETNSEEATESSEVKDVDLADYSLRVLNGSGISGQGSRMRQAFEDLGFGEIDVGNAKTNDSGETLVILVAGLPKQVKDLIISEVESLGLDYQIQESAELNYAAVITTAKP